MHYKRCTWHSAISVHLKTLRLLSNVPRHVNIVGLLNWGGGGGARALGAPPPPRSAPVSTCISTVAVSRYAKYTHEYLMSHPERGGHVPPGAPPPPPGSATDGGASSIGSLTINDVIAAKRRYVGLDTRLHSHTLVWF